MTHGSLLRRVLRHLATDRVALRRAFPRAALARIEAAIADGERHHRGQVRFAVEAALPLGRVLRHLTPRERALEVFGLLRVWDTAENCGVLVYLQFADRDIEIVADRGIDAEVGVAEWEAICRKMESAFRAGRYDEGVEAGIAEINALMARHYPRDGRGDGNELPDRPVIL